jgi:hypothetical protein
VELLPLLRLADRAGGSVSSLVGWLIGLENLAFETHSLDDDYPDVDRMGAWFSTAVMQWRESE